MWSRACRHVVCTGLSSYCTEIDVKHLMLQISKQSQVSELYQWNSQLAGLPLEWPAAGQLSGVIALKQRPGRRELVIGGFGGCAQVSLVCRSCA